RPRPRRGRERGGRGEPDAEPGGGARGGPVRARAAAAHVRGGRRAGAGGGAECVDHVLLYGPPGLGKTTLAGIIANEMGTNLVTTAGPAIERGADLMGILPNLGGPGVLFIDEVHRLPRAVEELLYPAMEDFAVNFVIDKGMHARTLKDARRPFTLRAASTS